MSPEKIAELEKRLTGTSTCNLYVDPEVVRGLMTAYRAEQATANKLKAAIKTILECRCDTVQTHVIQDVARRVMAEILGRMAATNKGQEPTQ